jgi:hypothetical protein
MAQAIQEVVEVYRENGVMPEVVVEQSRTGFEADARELRAGFYRHVDRAVIRPAADQSQGRASYDGVVVDEDGHQLRR